MRKEPITQNGFDFLEKKLFNLKTFNRQQILINIKNAREFGDLKENAEYHAAKEELFILDKKIKELENQILNSEIIYNYNKDNKMVSFGAIVTIKNMNNSLYLKYQIVGEYESNLTENKISIKSPLAKSIILKKKNDIVFIEIGSNIIKYKIMKIEYI